MTWLRLREDASELRCCAIVGKLAAIARYLGLRS